MNKTAIKNFAIWARKELIEKVTQRAKIYGIEKDKEMELIHSRILLLMKVIGKMIMQMDLESLNRIFIMIIKKQK